MKENARAVTVATVTARTIRPLSNAIPANHAGVLATRMIIASSLAAFGSTPPGTTFSQVDQHAASGRVRGEWVRATDHLRQDAVLLYLHGSAFVACSPRTHRGITSRLSAYANLPVYTCRYRRAPSHRFPTAADDAATAYRWLLDQGHTNILVAGDSAGGHMAIDLALELARQGQTGPRGLALFSPLYDATFALSAQQERIRRDPMVSAMRARQLVEHYTRGVDPAHNRLRLAIRDAPALPPVLIQAGGAEMLSADARQLAQDILAAGGRCELEIWPEQMHVFQALTRLIPEARPALRRAASFLEEALDQDPPGDSGQLTELREA
ncbi:MAG: alpha/beta hydrolase [Aeromicrobium sp.]